MIDNNDFSKRRFLFEDAIFRTFRPKKKKEIKGISFERGGEKLLLDFSKPCSPLA